MADVRKRVGGSNLWTTLFSTAVLSICVDHAVLVLTVISVSLYFNYFISGICIVCVSYNSVMVNVERA